MKAINVGSSWTYFGPWSGFCIPKQLGTKNATNNLQETPGADHCPHYCSKTYRLHADLTAPAKNIVTAWPGQIMAISAAHGLFFSKYAVVVLPVYNNKLPLASKNVEHGSTLNGRLSVISLLLWNSLTVRLPSRMHEELSPVTVWWLQALWGSIWQTPASHFQ